MALKKFRPTSPDRALSKTVGDTAPAKFGHLNELVDQANDSFARLENSIQSAALFASYNVTTPDNIICMGPSYTYPPQTVNFGPFDGGEIDIPCLTLKAWLVKGIQEWRGPSLISLYLGTLKIVPTADYFGFWSNFFPITVLPEKLTGMVLAGPDLFDPSTDRVVTPLCNGAKMWDVDAGTYNELVSMQVTLYSYGPADPVTGEVNYAMVLEGYCVVPTYDLSESFISYQVEFNLPTFFTPSVWID